MVIQYIQMATDMAALLGVAVCRHLFVAPKPNGRVNAETQTLTSPKSSPLMLSKSHPPCTAKSEKDSSDKGHTRPPITDLVITP
jgi:hypothetical protein